MPRPSAVLSVLPIASLADRVFTFTTAPSISNGNSSLEAPILLISSITSSAVLQILNGISLNLNDFR